MRSGQPSLRSAVISYTEDRTLPRHVSGREVLARRAAEARLVTLVVTGPNGVRQVRRNERQQQR
jgi:hypothetical protein